MRYYENINSRVLGGSPSLNSVKINEETKTYLLNNKIVYWYALKFDDHGGLELDNIRKKYRKKYLQSLKLLQSELGKHNIPFLLYKTHKFIPDIEDGDIDFMVKPTDFQKSLSIFNELGVKAVEDEPGKGKIEKEGYSVLEPHTTISWRGGSYLPTEIIWKKTEIVNESGLRLSNVSYEIEIISILSKILYEPSYMDLHSYLTLQFLITKISDVDSCFKLSSEPDSIARVYEYYLTQDVRKKKMPLFLPNILFMRLWTKNVFKSKNIKIYILHSIYFFYWKYRYLITNKLPFTHHHEWK